MQIAEKIRYGEIVFGDLTYEERNDKIIAQAALAINPYNIELCGHNITSDSKIMRNFILSIDEDELDDYIGFINESLFADIKFMKILIFKDTFYLNFVCDDLWANNDFRLHIERLVEGKHHKSS